MEEAFFVIAPLSIFFSYRYFKKRFIAQEYFTKALFQSVFVFFLCYEGLKVVLSWPLFYLISFYFLKNGLTGNLLSPGEASFVDMIDFIENHSFLFFLVTLLVFLALVFFKYKGNKIIVREIFQIKSFLIGIAAVVIVCVLNISPPTIDAIAFSLDIPKVCLLHTVQLSERLYASNDHDRTFVCFGQLSNTSKDVSVCGDLSGQNSTDGPNGVETEMGTIYKNQPACYYRVAVNLKQEKICEEIKNIKSIEYPQAQKDIQYAKCILATGKDTQALRNQCSQIFQRKITGDALQCLSKEFANYQDVDGDTLLMEYVSDSEYKRSDYRSEPQNIFLETYFSFTPDMNTENNEGETALHIAIRTFQLEQDRSFDGDLAMIEKLLKAGADPSHVNHYGTSPTTLVLKDLFLHTGYPINDFKVKDKRTELLSMLLQYSSPEQKVFVQKYIDKYRGLKMTNDGQILVRASIQPADFLIEKKLQDPQDVILLGRLEEDEKNKCVSMSSALIRPDTKVTEKENCYYTVARRYHDFKLCDNISDQVLKDACFSYAKDSDLNPGICRYMQDENNQFTCLEYDHRKSSEVEFCRDLPSGQLSEDCFYDVALKYFDETICIRSEKDMANECLLLLARKALDGKICAAVRADDDGGLMKQCILKSRIL